MSMMTIKQLTRLYIECDMMSPELIEVVGGRVACLCRSRPGNVEPNDDSAAIVQTISGAIVLIVADGVGGSPAGHKASAIAVESVTENVRAADPMSDLRSAILDGIEHANREILDLGIGAATTLAVVEIQDHVFRAYQVGDSLTLVIGQRGAIKWKSTPHSPVGYAIESGMLDEVDAIHHDELHVVSNLVGCRKMHIEIGPSQPLAARDTVIVATDGLCDNLYPEEIIEHGRSGKLLGRITRLMELATDRMSQSQSDQPSKPDDLTILMYSS
jgi:serine/threonine protein phosphatase PrpC